MAKKRTKIKPTKDVHACCCDKNPCVGIGASLGGIFIVITALFLIFASHLAGLLVPIVMSFAVLGIFLGYFTTKRK